MNTNSETIREARRLLFEFGWCQHRLINEEGKLCLEGALGVAANGTTQGNVPQSLLQTVGKAAYPEGNPEVFGVYIWNDAEGRTFAEIVEALDRAEKIAEAEERQAS